jgi:hypothetical protein
MANDMVDRFLSTVSGLENVGDDDDEDSYVGAAAPNGMRNANRLPSPRFARSQRDTVRRAAGGFAQFSLAAAIGATATGTMKVSRVVNINRLLIIPSGAGIVMDSVKVGDEEQLLQSGVPVELYGTAALTDTLPDDFSPLASGIDLVITLRNTTAGALTALAGIKGDVKR